MTTAVPKKIQFLKVLTSFKQATNLSRQNVCIGINEAFHTLSLSSCDRF